MASLSLASIPAEVLALIFTYLQCFADLTSVAGVCKDWRNAVHMRLRDSQQPRYRQLPWLLQPSYEAPPSTLTSYVSGATGRRIRLPEVLRGSDRFCGSHEGGWVAVAANRSGTACYALVNLIDQAAGARIIPLPSTLGSSHRTGLEMAEIRMVTLSGVPTAAGSCIAAALTVGGYPSLIFCRPHVDRHWVPPVLDTEPLQDTLYHRGEVYQGFYAISKTDKLYVFLPTASNNGAILSMSKVVLSSSSSPALQATGGRVGGSTITRYLVESRGKLLLVLRYSGTAMGTADLRTLHFRVFEMALHALPNGGGHSAAWIELDGLDGRVITVARGCSRAFEAGQYRGFQGGSIYYLDDAVVAGRDYPIYSFADLGMYSMGETSTKIKRPGLLPTPELRGSSLDGGGGAPQAQGSSARMHPSRPQATETERMAWLLRQGDDDHRALDGGPEHLRMLAGCEPSSNNLYGPRELMVRTIRSSVSHAATVFSRLKIVREIDHLANDEASSSTSSAGGAQQVVHETVASVCPLLCKPGNRRPIWFLPPSAEEWLLPPQPPADA